MIALMRNPLAALLLAVLIIGGIITGAGWYLAAHDRNVAREELIAERERSAQLAASVARQNEAIDGLAKDKAAAEERGRAAQQLAAANGKRFDQALARTRAATATTCTEAMPVVNDVLETIR